MTWTWVEPFAGAAACALRLVGGPGLAPPVAWMGGKRRLAAAILGAIGVPEGRPARVLLADAGPWGWVWPLLLEASSAAAVASVLRSWSDEDPTVLWDRLAAVPPADEIHERAAQWLWLQARAAQGVPVWWNEWRWVASNGHGDPVAAGQKSIGGWRVGKSQGRTSDQRAWQKGYKPAWRMGEEVTKARRGDRTLSQKGTARATGGITTSATVADRIDAIALAFKGVDVLVGLDASAAAPCLADPVPGFVYLDPPYQGATGYGWDCPRAEVLELARRWADAGAVVAVSEAVPLELAGWHHVNLTLPGGKPEWLTLSRPAARLPERQLPLFGAP